MGVGHPPARADGGTLSHGELRVLSHLSLGFPAMPRTREQRRMKTAGEWADLPDELLAKVLAKVLEAATQEGGLGFTKASAKLRLVSAQWKTVRDAMVKRLVLKKKATDEGMGVLVRRFPAMVSLEFKWAEGRSTNEILVKLVFFGPAENPARPKVFYGPINNPAPVYYGPPTNVAMGNPDL